jgi:hypothetical protein
MRTAAACLLLATATTAATAGDKPEAAAADPVVCRSAPVTGTRITSSECHLKSEWPDIDAARHKRYEEFNRQMNSGAGAERAISNSPLPR